MKILGFTLLFLFLIFPPIHAADLYYAGLGKQLIAQGAPSSVPVTGDTEEQVLSGFELTYLSGLASKEEIFYKGLPFSLALKLQSQSAPDQTWHHFIQRPIGHFAAGEVGVLVFSIRADSDAVAPVGASIKGADDPYPFLLNAAVTPTKSWQTVYLPFQTPADAIQSKANLAFFFGGAPSDDRNWRHCPV